MNALQRPAGYLDQVIAGLLEEGFTIAGLHCAIYDAASACHKASSDEQEAARRRYGSDDIEIDATAMASRADDGMWVQAWLWLPADEEE